MVVGSLGKPLSVAPRVFDRFGPFGRWRFGGGMLLAFLRDARVGGGHDLVGEW